MDTAGVQVRETEDGAHGRCLAGTVRTQEADHLARRHFEGEIVQGGHVAVRAAQALKFEQTTHSFTLGPVKGATSDGWSGLGERTVIATTCSGWTGWPTAPEASTIRPSTSSCAVQPPGRS